MKLSSIKFKLIVGIITCLVLASFAIIYLLNYSYKNNINVIAEQSIMTSEQAFANLEKNDTNMLSSTLQAILTNSEIKKAFMEKDREKLYNITSPLFKELKERYRITHWYFHNPESEKSVFLRVHNKEKFDDALKRVTYLDSINKKDFAAGKELGKTAFALRVVHPYYDGDKVIGYMEMGEEIDHFVGIMKEQTGNDFGLLILKKNLDEKEWATMREAKGLPNNWNDREDVVLVDKTTEDEHIIDFAGNLENIPNGGQVLEEFKKGDSVFVRGIFPVFDAANNKVGGVFVLRDITPIYNEMKAMQTKVIVAILLLVCIISIFLIFIMNSLVIKRLNNMINIATMVVGGAYNTEIAASSDDEIGQFESLFEQFRIVFVNLIKDFEEKENK